MKLYCVYKPFLRAGPMPTSSWPPQNELNGIFVGSFIHNTLIGFLSLSLLQVFCIYIIVSGFLILWDFCVSEHVCLFIYVFLVLFSLATFLLFVCLFSHSLVCLFLFYDILLIFFRLLLVF